MIKKSREYKKKIRKGKSKRKDKIFHKFLKYLLIQI